MEWHASLRHKKWMRQSTPISYLNFRQQFFFSQCCRLAVMLNEKKWKKLSFSKSSTRAEIITFKLAIFLFMIKYEFEMSAWKIWERIPLHHLSSLCLYLFRVFSILFIHLLLFYIHSAGMTWKIHESLMDLFWWIHFTASSLDVFRSRGRNFHHLLPSHRLKFHSSLCRLRYWSKLKYLKKILGFADLKHFIMLWGKEIIFKLFIFS